MLRALRDGRIRRATLSVLVFAAGFPLMTRFVTGGELFGAFMIIPLTLIAWQWGERSGLVAALGGIAYTEAVFSVVYFLVRRKPLDPYWVMMAVAPGLVFLFIGIALGRLGDTARTLAEALAAKRRMEEELRGARDRAQGYLDIAGVMLLGLDLEGRITLLNRKGYAILGYEEGELRDKDWVDTCLPLRAHGEARKAFRSLIHGGLDDAGNVENPVLTKKGEERLIGWHTTLLSDPTGAVLGSLSSGEDITERKNLEEQFLQVQKMEAVGRLAGGIAHDFNNILMIIMGFCELIRSAPDDRAAVTQDVQVIRESAERAASLTEQLLAFSRKQQLSPQVLDVNQLVLQWEDMLARMVGEDIRLSVHPAEEPSMTRVDATQFQQVMVNLAANARDAMPGGGELTIEIRDILLSDSDAPTPADLGAGPYVLVRVSDTGPGVDADVRRRLFDPYFTTKETGKGRGLGLSIAYGIVRQSGGSIDVDAAPGGGTSFRIYLPRILAEGIDIG